MDVVSCDMEEDPFLDIDEEADLQELINDVMPIQIAAVHKSM